MNITSIETISTAGKNIVFTANKGINLICGANGAGKSEILTAIAATSVSLPNIYKLNGRIAQSKEINELHFSIVNHTISDFVDAVNCINSSPNVQQLFIDGLKFCMNPSIIGYNHDHEYNLIVQYEDGTNTTLYSSGDKVLVYDLMLVAYAVIESIVHPNITLLDDACQNYDANRTRLFCSWLLEKLKYYPNAQFIMATNNIYAINSFPLKTIIAVEKYPNEFKVYTYENSKTHYDRFGYTGLSNFDFIDTKFYCEELI